MVPPMLRQKKYCTLLPAGEFPPLLLMFFSFQMPVTVKIVGVLVVGLRTLHWPGFPVCLVHKEVKFLVKLSSTVRFFSSNHCMLSAAPDGKPVPKNDSRTRNAYGGAVANRLRRRTSDQTVFGSNPAVAAAYALSPWTRLFTPIVPRRSLHISFY